MIWCLVVATHRVVMGTFMPACGSLSVLRHLFPHTNLLEMGLIMPFISDIFIENAFNFHNLIIESHSV